MDEQGKKYYAMNGFEGGRIEPWNSITDAYVVAPNETQYPVARFPMVDHGVEVINFYSPRIHGQQGEWFITGMKRK